jgi:hypothetical protein
MADGNDGNGYDANLTEEFRASRGRVGGPFHGADILLLHHTGGRAGARTGAEPVSPLGDQSAPRPIPVVVLEPVK